MRPWRSAWGRVRSGPLSGVERDDRFWCLVAVLVDGTGREAVFLIS